MPVSPHDTPRTAPAPPGDHALREQGLHSRWLVNTFRVAYRAPWVLRLVRPFILRLAWCRRPELFHGARLNARHILGRAATHADCDRLAQATVASFYDFIADTGRALRRSREQLLEQIESIEGIDRYNAARAADGPGRGAILATAHLGSFEVGAAAMLQREDHVHIIYYRDPRDGFEPVRAAHRKQIGILEAPVNEGWNVWVNMRDALADDHVVLVQGDRVMPGQKGIAVPFFDGHIKLPAGPFKLAMLAGSPIIPVFAIRTKQGRVKVFLEDAIHMPPTRRPINADHPAVQQLARVIERYVRTYPEQWHVLTPAWCEDQPDADEQRP